MKISFKNGNIYPVIIIFLFYILSIIVFPRLFISIFNITNKNLIYYILVFFGFFGIFLMSFYLRKRKINSIEFSEKKSFGYSFLIACVGFFLVVNLQILVTLILRVLGFDVISLNTNTLTKIIKEHKIFLLYAVIIAPILEELFFRKTVFGYLYDIFNVKNKIVKFIIPAFITGVIFALLHDGLSSLVIIYLMISMLFSFAYLHTKRIITPIIMHVLMNSLVMVAQFLT